MPFSLADRIPAAIRRLTPAFALLLPLAFLAASCSKDDDPAPAVRERERSVLVYMVANNSLGSSTPPGKDERGYDNADIDEMVNAASTGALGANRLIVYHHAYRQDPVLKEITAQGVKELKTYDTSVSSVSASRMLEVIADFKVEAPADKYGIVLWSHANGWAQTGLQETVAPTARPKAFGEDYHEGRRVYMNVTTLADVLDGQGFDYVYFDCCHMAGVEVAYELRNVTDRVVGSVTELPAAGMPYNLTLPYLMSGDVVMAAATTFSSYNNLYGVERTCTMSVIDTSRLDRLADAVGALYAMHPVLPDDYTPQEFIYRNCIYFDLQHYLEGLGGTRPELRKPLAEATAALKDAVVYCAATPWIWQGYASQVELKSHCGLSTNILKSPLDAAKYNYSQLEWYADVASRLF